jgi:hypothetical protein
MTMYIWACPRCGAQVDECEHCELFMCWGCGRWLPWENGQNGSAPNACDQCWQMHCESYESHQAPASASMPTMQRTNDGFWVWNDEGDK